jgi:glutathione S-transferase
MMTLHSAPPSPFGRKVKIAAALLGLSDQMSVTVADTLNPNDRLRTENPLGKIPALVLESGDVVHDSAVIVDYLDQRAGGGIIIPRELHDRFRVLTLQSVGDGIAEAALLIVYESRWRDESMRHAGWTEHQHGKITRTLAVLEANPPTLENLPNAGAIAVACALGYLDLRLGGFWRATHPKLVAWLTAFEAAVPAFAHTRVVPAP